MTFQVDRDRQAARDARVAALDEVLGGIRGIKYEAQEDYWENRIGKLRKAEVKLQRTRYWLGSCYNLIWYAVDAPFLVLNFAHYR